MPQPTPKDHYVSISELAARTGLSHATIWRLKRGGKIPFFQPGGKNGRVLFPADAIERALGGPPQATPDDAPPERLPGPQPSWMSPKPPT